MRRAGELSDGREDEALRDEAAREEEAREEGQGEDVLALYLEDLKQIPALKAEEEARLLEQLRADREDSRARKRLTEAYLETALAEIRPYLGRMDVGELIGVANLALTAALCDEKTLESAVLRDTIKRNVHTALEEAVQEGKSERCGRAYACGASECDERHCERTRSGARQGGESGGPCRSSRHPAR